MYAIGWNWANRNASKLLHLSAGAKARRRHGGCALRLSGIPRRYWGTAEVPKGPSIRCKCPDTGYLWGNQSAGDGSGGPLALGQGVSGRGASCGQSSGSRRF